MLKMKTIYILHIQRGTGALTGKPISFFNVSLNSVVSKLFLVVYTVILVAVNF